MLEANKDRHLENSRRRVLQIGHLIHVAATGMAQVFQTTPMISDAQCDWTATSPLLGINSTKICEIIQNLSSRLNFSKVENLQGSQKNSRCIGWCSHHRGLVALETGPLWNDSWKCKFRDRTWFIWNMVMRCNEVEPDSKIFQMVLLAPGCFMLRRHYSWHSFLNASTQWARL